MGSVEKNKTYHFIKLVKLSSMHIKLIIITKMLFNLKVFLIFAFLICRNSNLNWFFSEIWQENQTNLEKKVQISKIKVQIEKGNKRPNKIWKVNKKWLKKKIITKSRSKTNFKIANTCGTEEHKLQELWKICNS